VAEKMRGVIGREEFFGELAVMYATPRTATVRAKTDVTCLSLSRDDLNSTISASKIAKLAVVARSRLFLGVPLLSALDTTCKAFVTSSLKEEVWPEGTVLARQGSMVHGDIRRMFIILDGKCTREIVSSSFHGEEEKEGIETIRHGHFFNMFAMWYGCPCSATVVVLSEKCTTLSISYDELMNICNHEVERPRAGGRRHSLLKRERPVSVTLEAIRGSMWRHLLMLLFLKLKQEKLARNQEALEFVSQQSKEVTFKTWDMVFTKGKAYDTVFILETGTLSEHKGDIAALRDADELTAECVQHRVPGESFGEKCLHGKEHNVPTSTLCASSECTMLALPGDVLRRVLRSGYNA
jgi:CRP-like cAMP-binding protein